MTLQAYRRDQSLHRPVAAALLEYLLLKRNPTHARIVRDDLALGPREFTLALRTLERSGLARSLLLGSPARLAGRHQYFVEATQLALDPAPPVAA